MDQDSSPVTAEALPVLNPKFKWYKINLMGTSRQKVDYYFRGLTATEKRIFARRREKNVFAGELYLLQTAVANQGIDWNEVFVGVANKLSEEIAKASGLIAAEEDESVPPILEEISEYLKTPVGAQEAAAVLSVPGLKLEHLHDCDPWYYYWYLLVGQIAFYMIFRRTPEELFDPKAAAQSNYQGEYSRPGHLPVDIQPGERRTMVEEQFVLRKG